MTQKSPGDWMRDNIWQFIGVVVAIIAIIISTVFALLQLTPKVDATKPTLTPGTTNSSIVTPIPTVTPTLVTTPSATPTSPPTPTPTPIPTKPTLAQAEVIPSQPPLQCDSCSDPVLVTITKIIVEPSQKRMLWYLSISNTSQVTLTPYFDKFFLQEGDQINNPTGPGDQPYKPTGPMIPIGASANNLYLEAGQHPQETLIFTFVPYKNSPYTLTSELKDFSMHLDITFNQVVLRF